MAKDLAGTRCVGGGGGLRRNEALSFPLPRPHHPPKPKAESAALGLVSSVYNYGNTGKQKPKLNFIAFSTVYKYFLN